MKNVINYYYNFNIDNLRMIGGHYYFVYQNRKFIFQEIKDTQFDYEAIFELNQILVRHHNLFYKIIVNKNNQIITQYANKQYILMIDYSKEDRKFTLPDLLEIDIPVNDENKVINRLNRSNWTNLWQRKIDYFELFIEHNINKYIELNKYMNYFIGIGENAILYAKNTIEDVKPNYYDRPVISHKRIDSDISIKQLYNPINLVVDHPARDIAEFLKTIFWNHTYQKINLEVELEDLHLSSYGARLVIARMLFPSFFFDAFERLVENKIEQTDIFYIIDRINEYEQYLSTIYHHFKMRYNIPEVGWLKKIDYSSTLTTPNTSGTSFTSIDSTPSFSVTSIMLQ